MYDCVLDRLLRTRWHLGPLPLGHIRSSKLCNYCTDPGMMPDWRVEGIDAGSGAILIPYSPIECRARPATAVAWVCSNYFPELIPPALELVFWDQVLNDDKAMMYEVICLRCSDSNRRIDWPALHDSWRLLVVWRQTEGRVTHIARILTWVVGKKGVVLPRS